MAKVRCRTCGQPIDEPKKNTFESRQKQIKNVAMAIPDVANTNIHNYSTAWVGIILSGLVCFLVLLPVAWWVGIFLLDQAGYKKPEESLANGLLLFAVALPALALASWLLERVPKMIIREIAEWRLQEKEIDLQGLKLKALAGQASVPTAANLTDSDVRFVRVVKQVIGAAYIHLASKGLYKPKEVRPWSRDVCKETILMWDNRKIGWNDAVRLGKYITDNEIIIDSQLNEGRYPTMDAVKDLLDKDFTRPIVKGYLSPTT